MFVITVPSLASLCKLNNYFSFCARPSASWCPGKCSVKFPAILMNQVITFLNNKALKWSFQSSQNDEINFYLSFERTGHFPPHYLHHGLEHYCLFRLQEGKQNSVPVRAASRFFSVDKLP
jgi:hypothetical protein